MKSSSLSSSPNRGIVVALVTTVICLMLLIGFYADDVISERIDSITITENKTLSLSLPHHRKLLHNETENVNGNVTERGVEPNRIWTDKCSKSDIVISQGHTEPLPSGIPTYTVEIMNVCISGCDISAIHLTCGWFSSARLINPRVFRRLGFNDCLVNNGKPLASGRALSFQYANTYPYSLSVSSLRC